MFLQLSYAIVVFFRYLIKLTNKIINDIPSETFRAANSSFELKTKYDIFQHVELNFRMFTSDGR